MSVGLLESAAAALDELVDEVVFVGGATLVLWITDPAAPPPRPTLDVDVIVEVTGRFAFAEFEQRLRDRGFAGDQESGVICRWKHPVASLVLDAMPQDAAILGFANVWQGRAVPHAAQRRLPSGVSVKVVTPPFLLATKLEAFASRGRDDFLGSRDFGDVVSLLDGRPELVQEVRDSPPDLRDYLADAFVEHRSESRFLDGIRGGLLPDDASQVRAEAVVLPRIQEIIESRTP